SGAFPRLARWAWGFGSRASGGTSRWPAQLRKVLDALVARDGDRALHPQTIQLADGVDDLGQTEFAHDEAPRLWQRAEVVRHFVFQAPRHRTHPGKPT